jgi:hypothetical protein
MLMLATYTGVQRASMMPVIPAPEDIELIRNGWLGLVMEWLIRTRRASKQPPPDN